TFEVKRISEVKTFEVASLQNPGANEGPTGIVLTDIAKVQLPLLLAIKAGFQQAYYMTGVILSQLGSLFTTSQGIKQVGGPVKIAQLVGQVRLLGFIPLLNLTALLSLSLAVLNIMPFPALDGGRVLFLFIEKIRRKKNNQKVEQFFNTAGFIFLLILMAAVTAHDIFGKK
ncbi:MAG TPA: site-2 protease family protein, partial [Candidatus Limnocylindria bacterium]|nr:site-2 protease family protein [Candidatus Limnocylindria bacterium]